MHRLACRHIAAMFLAFAAVLLSLTVRAEFAVIGITHFVAAGANPIKATGIKDVNMQDLATSDWPIKDKNLDINVWHHSDIRKVALYYTINSFKYFIGDKGETQ